MEGEGGRHPFALSEISKLKEKDDDPKLTSESMCLVSFASKKLPKKKKIVPYNLFLVCLFM